MLREALGEARCLCGHFGWSAVKAERQADDDAAHLMLAGEQTKPAEVVAAICACKRYKRTRGDAQLIGNREAEALAAVVNRKDAAALCG